MQLLGKMLGDPNKKELNIIQPTIDKINPFAPAIKTLSDEELAAKTKNFVHDSHFTSKAGWCLKTNWSVFSAKH